MVLRLSAGGEEGHVSNGALVGGWSNVSAGVIREATIVYTGAYSYKMTAAAAGSSPNAGSQALVEWSDALYFTMWGDGTYRYLWHLGSGDSGSYQRYVGLNKGADTSHAKLALYSDTVGTTLAESAEFNYAEFQLLKWEFNAGNWTFWGKLDGGVWAELFTYDDTGNFTILDGTEMSINVSTNETKGEAYICPYHDDVHFWDDDGDNWNSRLPADDFPRISVAHMPITPDSEGGSPEWQEIDEIPPDGNELAGIDEPKYWSNVESLKGAPQDLTGEVLQAVMVTHVALDVVDDTELKKFNLYDGAALYADSEEAVVQAGYETTAGHNYATFAGYFPWTPDATPENWDEDLFNAYNYGISLINGITDQMTAQVIFGGSSHWWTPPAVSARRIFIT